MKVKSNSTPPQVSGRHSLRQLVTFQFKLAMDALRDFALSPISIIAFIIDAVRKPAPEDSLHHRLMVLGQRSDRIINLFNEYTEADHYTVDQTLTEVERTLFREWLNHRQKNQDPAEGSPPPGKV